MGVKIVIDGRDYEVASYSVSEDSTPLDGGDSSGSVGTFSISAIIPDPALAPDHPVNKWGAHILKNKTVQTSQPGVAGEGHRSIPVCAGHVGHIPVRVTFYAVPNLDGLVFEDVSTPLVYWVVGGQGGVGDDRGNAERSHGT